MKNSATAKTIDEYLSTVSEDARKALEKLRSTIKSVAPKATEVISYQMPGFKYHGMLVFFAAFKTHCSFFPGSSVIAAYKDELKSYETSKGTIRFTTEKPLPTALVKKLVKARVAENEAKLKAKQKKR